MAECCATTIVTSNYQKVNKSIDNVKTASSSVELDMDTSQLQGVKLPTNTRKAIIPLSQMILNTVEITINANKAHALIDPGTINGELTSANSCCPNRIPTEDINSKPLETGIKGSRSTMTKKANVELNIQDNKISRTFYVSNLRDRDAILWQPSLPTLNVIMYIKTKKVSIKLMGKHRQELHMLL